MEGGREVGECARVSDCLFVCVNLSPSIPSPLSLSLPPSLPPSLTRYSVKASLSLSTSGSIACRLSWRGPIIFRMTSSTDSNFFPNEDDLP